MSKLTLTTEGDTHIIVTRRSASLWIANRMGIRRSTCPKRCTWFRDCADHARGRTPH